MIVGIRKVFKVARGTQTLQTVRFPMNLVPLNANSVSFMVLTSGVTSSPGNITFSNLISHEGSLTVQLTNEAMVVTDLIDYHMQSIDRSEDEVVAFNIKQNNSYQYSEVFAIFYS